MRCPHCGNSYLEQCELDCPTRGVGFNGSRAHLVTPPGLAPPRHPLILPEAPPYGDEQSKWSHALKVERAFREQAELALEDERRERVHLDAHLEALRAQSIDAVGTVGLIAALGRRLLRKVASRG